MTTGPNRKVESIIEVVKRLPFGTLMSTREVALAANINIEKLKDRHGPHPALAAYRFTKGNGHPMLWGSKKTIKKVIEAHAQ